MHDSELVKRIWKYANKYKWAFAFSYTILVIELIFAQFLPLLLGGVINSAVYEADFIQFLVSTIYYALVFLGYALCGFTQLQLWQRIHNKYIYDIRIACYRKVLHMKPPVLANIKSGDVIKTINSDTAEFHHIIQRYAMRIINAGIGTVVSLIIVASMKWEIAILMFIIIPFSALANKKVEAKMKSASDEVRSKQGQYLAWTTEILKGMREVKLFAAENTVLMHFMHKNRDIVNSIVKQDITQFKSNELINCIYFIADFSFYIICAIFVAKGSINIGEYVAIASYFSMVSMYVKRVLQGNVDYQRRKTCVERVFTLLDEDEEKDDELLELRVTSGVIEVKDLYFSYDVNNDILKNINIKIKSGEKIGVVGQSGVGKSTLANLLLKFYEPQNGEICIDGTDLRNCKCSSLRKQVGIVSQENIIFEATVRENITFGMPATDELLWKILERVCLKDEIDQLPLGLDTIIGGAEISLSGGQNQRLCIARLFFRNPKIVILDEATSALDAQSEQIVQDALENLTKDKTTIVISHRYKALLHTDRILVLKDGEQVGCDSFEELLANNSYFATMFKKQMEISYEI